MNDLLYLIRCQLDTTHQTFFTIAYSLVPPLQIKYSELQTFTQYHWLQLKNNKHTYHQLVRHGNYRLVKKHSLQLGEYTLILAAASGSLPLVQYLAQYKAVDIRTINAAVRGGHLHIVQEFRQQGYQLDIKQLEIAAYYGHIHIMKYLYEECRLRPTLKCLLASLRHIAGFRWLYGLKVVNFSHEDTHTQLIFFSTCLHTNNPEILNIVREPLLHFYRICQTKITMLPIIHGKLASLQWLVAEGFTISIEDKIIWQKAAQYPDIFRWLLQNTTDPHPDAYIYAARHVELQQYVRLSPEILDHACFAGNLPLVQQIITTYDVSCTEKMLQSAIYSGNHDLISWLRGRIPELTVETTLFALMAGQVGLLSDLPREPRATLVKYVQNYLSYFVAKGYSEIIAWLLEHQLVSVASVLLEITSIKSIKVLYWLCQNTAYIEGLPVQKVVRELSENPYGNVWYCYELTE